MNRGSAAIGTASAISQIDQSELSIYLASRTEDRLCLRCDIGRSSRGPGVLQGQSPVYLFTIRCRWRHYNIPLLNIFKNKIFLKINIVPPVQQRSLRGLSRIFLWTEAANIPLIIFLKFVERAWISNVIPILITISVYYIIYRPSVCPCICIYFVILRSNIWWNFVGYSSPVESTNYFKTKHPTALKILSSTNVIAQAIIILLSHFPASFILQSREIFHYTSSNINFNNL